MAPSRGNLLPLVSGMTAGGEPLSLRDFYMRRNMAIVIVGNDAQGQAWLASAAEQQDAASREAGVVVAITPSGVDAHGLRAIIDPDGHILQKLGLRLDELPVLFLLDRYGKIFATNVGASAEPGLDPSAIPGWLEFIACRCS